ncbi:DUF3606 domain-containing protein [Azonexus sp.]|uniref:DUF3606 domain-containing protein n=1 Tax=Azonexus sp. TaxID=1872668 RepID=UPI0027B9A38C|nr:DUF3606 domain-containing protein [Azonexus sp.]
MSDNLKIKGPQDPHTINLNQPHEVDYWTEKLGVTEQQLRNAVGAVGNSVQKVEDHLKP